MILLFAHADWGSLLPGLRLRDCLLIPTLHQKFSATCVFRISPTTCTCIPIKISIIKTKKYPQGTMEFPKINYDWNPIIVT